MALIKIYTVPFVIGYIYIYIYNINIKKNPKHCELVKYMFHNETYIHISILILSADRLED